MKKLILLVTISFTAFFTNAQNVAINNDGTSAASSAMLDVKSSTKGMLMPRMTTAQRTAIASPALGLLVFDTDTKTIWAFNGTSWSNLTSTGGGSLTLPFDQTVALAGTAFKVSNTGTAIEGITSGVSSNGVRGIATANGSNGVYGGTTAASGVGVRGESTTGTGMIAYSTSGTGLNASSISGTGIYANSLSGLALNVNGNLKIAGGNTSPGEGKVLTSDAVGNAVWKTDRVGFKAFGINPNYVSVAQSVWRKLYFATEFIDLANNFTPYPVGTAPDVNSSTFSIPVDGLYHFESNLFMSVPNDPTSFSLIRFTLNRNGVVSTLQQYPGLTPYTNDFFDNKGAYLKISGDFVLFTGDKVYVEVFQVSDNGSAGVLSNTYESYFSGNLVKAL